MKKKFLKLTLCLGLIAAINVSCIGSFKLTSNLHSWNQQIGSKFVNELVFLGLVIIPVYEIAMLGDAIIFNTIEFWGGSNPIAMNPGDSESQIVKSENGTKYKVTAEQNKFIAKQLNGDNKGDVVEFDYDVELASWSMTYNGETKKISEQEGDLLKVFGIDGDEIAYTQEQINTVLAGEQNLAYN